MTDPLKSRYRKETRKGSCTAAELSAAATHREKMTPETVAAEIVGGVCTRGSIQKALNQWGDYLGDRRCRSSLGEIGAEDEAGVQPGV
jgi:hypothetical protein